MMNFKKRLLSTVALSALLLGTISCGGTDASNGGSGGADVAATPPTTTPTPVLGKTFLLTEGLDHITGTSADDTFIGTDWTYNAGDWIDGGEGTDALFLTFAESSNGLVDHDNIELVYIRTSIDQTFDISSWLGMTQMWYDRGTANVVVTNGQNLFAVGVKGGDGSPLGNYTVYFKASVVEGPEDSIPVLLNDSHIHNLTASGVETFDLTSDGSDENILNSLAGDAVTQVTVTGANKLTVTTDLAAGVITYDGSAGTGAQYVGFLAPVTSSASKVSVKTGHGDDLVRATTLDANAVSGTLFDGGPGIDTLVVDGQLDETLVDMTPVTGELINFEGMQFNTDMGYDFDGHAWVTFVNVNSDIIARTLTDLPAGTSVKFMVDTSGITLNHVDKDTAGNQSMFVSLDGLAAVTAALLTIDGIEHITLTSTGKAANTVTDLSASGLNDLTITGDQPLTLTTSADIGSSVNAFDFTKLLTHNLTAQTSPITYATGPGGSTLTFNAESANAHILTLASGVDTLVFTNAFSSISTNAIGAQVLVNGWGSNDIIQLTGGALVTDSNQGLCQDAVSALSSATLTEEITACYAAFGVSADDVIWFESTATSDTIVTAEEGTLGTTFVSGTDWLLSLDGHSLGLTSANFSL